MQKGQLTVFIIIGVLALFAVGSAIYVIQENAEGAQDELPKVEQISVEFEPVREFIQDCLERVAIQNFERAGDQGGYIGLNQLNNLDLKPLEPTESDGVFFAIGSELAIPYWWHMTSENECRGGCDFSSALRPRLSKTSSGDNSIEGQIATNIERDLPDCLRDYKPLQAQAFRIEERGQKSVMVSINENDVLVRLNMPINAFSGDIREEMAEFFVPLDLNFKSIYLLATNITKMQATNNFIEKHVRNLIDIYSRLDADHMPPVSDMDFQIGPGTTWVKFNVQQRLEEVLALYMPFLQVPGSQSFLPVSDDTVVDTDLIDAVMNRGMSVPLVDEAGPYKIRFTYLDWWPIYFDLNCRGQVCQGESTINTFGFIMGLQRYNFAYDVSVPVLVEIFDAEALNGRGYSFKFFLEGNLRNNEPMTVTSEQFGNPEPPLTGSLLCDAQQQNVPITIDTVNAKTGGPIDIPVVFACGEEACGIGASENGRLEGFIPQCIGGTVLTQSPEHGQVSVPIDVVDTTPVNLTLQVHEPQAMSVNVKKLRLAKTNEDWVISGSKENARNLLNNEQAIAIFTRKGGGGGLGDVGIAQIYDNPTSARNRRDSVREVQFVPGTYDVNIILMSRNTIRIEPRVTCFDQGTLTFDQECITVPEETIEFNRTNPLMIGGLQMEIEVTEEMLSQGDQLEMYAFWFDYELESRAGRLALDDLDELSRIEALSVEERNRVLPEVRRQ